MLKISNRERWAELYQKALFEDDAKHLPTKVQEAQHAIRQRARELWQATSTGQAIDLRERQELETALYFLNLLQSIEAQRKVN